MKKIYLIVLCSFFLLGCSMNPSKEARLQKLETEMEQTRDSIHKLEHRIKVLEAANNQ